MKLSLFYKLIGAFTLVILLGAVATYLTARMATRNQFQGYVSLKQKRRYSVKQIVIRTAPGSGLRFPELFHRSDSNKSILVL